MTNFCPCCGHNFTADQPIERDGWQLVPRGAAIYCDQGARA